jgi:acetylornithine deacetylase/succinyl-diaminopimelate desuccinylase-like protein
MARMRLTTFLALSLCATSLDATEPTADYKAQALDLFRHAIAFKTEVGPGQVPPMAQYLAERLRLAGFAPEDIHIVPLGETASLIVRYRGRAGNLKPILASAHMDVVTAKPSDWQRDPFTLVEENGYHADGMMRLSRCSC